MKLAHVSGVLLGLGLLSLAFGQNQPPKMVHIHGIVVDEAGSPVAGALVGPYLRRMDTGASAPSWQSFEGEASTITGEDGKFEEEVPAKQTGSGLQIKLLNAVNSQTGTAGYAKVAAVRSPVRIVLHRLAEVHGDGTLKGLNCSTPLSFYPETADGTYLLSFATHPGQPLLLPPGKYIVHVTSPEGISSQDEPVTVSQNCGPVAMGPVVITPNMMRSLYGKTPPAFVASDARGVPVSVQPSDFKGKWLVVDFWGYKCHPCVTESIPGLIKFYNDHPEYRDRYQVITVHIDYPKGYGLDAGRHFDTLEPELKTLEKAYWGGKELPFPILLDETGAITKGWGIHEIPHQVLIDPNGNVVKDAVGLLGGGDCLDALASGLAAERREQTNRR